MKATKRILCLLLALCMVFSLTTVAFADESLENSASAEDEAVENTGDFSEAVEAEGVMAEETVVAEAANTVVADDHTVIIPVGSSATVSIPDSSYASGTYTLDTAVASASVKEIEATTTPERATTIVDGNKYYIIWANSLKGAYLTPDASNVTTNVSSAGLWTAIASEGGFVFQSSNGKYLYFEFVYSGKDNGTLKLSVSTSPYVFEADGCTIKTDYTYTDENGATKNGTYNAGYACDELTPASTEVNFTGLSAGTTTCTFTNASGETVTYTVVVTQSKEITVEAGKDYAIGCEATDPVYTSELDTSIATVSDVDSSSGTAATYTKATEITAGKQYIIVGKKNLGAVLTQTVSTDNDWSTSAFIMNKDLATVNSDGTITPTQDLSSYLWTVESNSDVDGLAIKTVNEQYIVFNKYNVYLQSASSGAAGRVVSNGVSGEFNIMGSSDTNGYKLNDYGNAGTTAAGYNSSIQADENIWYFYEYTPGSTAKVTVHGVTPGDTYVTVGATRYTIHVIPSSQTVNMYLSTFGVWDINDGSKATHVTISSADEGVNTANGIALSTKVPEKGGWAYAGSVDTVYWKGVVLHDGTKQSDHQDEDFSMSGTDYQYIRFWNGVWSVSADQTTWTDIKSDDEVNAYYLQKTSVTNEVTTYVKDWAFLPGNTSDYSSATRDEKALSFAVVYPDGQIKTESEIYASSTLLYWDNLNPMTFVRVGVNDQYEVVKMTYTFGHRTCDGLTNMDNTDSDIEGMTHTYWTTSDAITWNKKTVKVDDKTTREWYDETVCWDPTSEVEKVSKYNEPVFNGADWTDEIYAGDAQDTKNGSQYNGNWGDNDALLILIYLKPVKTPDSLHVQYWDDSGDAEIYSYFVNINNESTSETGTFLNRLTDNGTVIGEQGPWTGATASDEKYLPDTAYVVNAAGVNKTFQKDLLKIPDLSGKYTSGLYTYAWAEVSSADSKTLILHYVLDDSKLTKSYVIDFGLPVDIPAADLKIADYSDVSVQDGTYGTAAITTKTLDDETTIKYITYTPTTVVQGCDTVIVTYTFKATDASTGAETVTTHNYTLLIYPATTVFYEEGFITYNGDNWGGSASRGNTTQAAEQLGSSSNYGRDDTAYGSATGASNGTQATSTAADDTATFTFTGTGIDLYGNLDTSDAYVIVKITNDEGSIKAYNVIDATLAAGVYAATKYQGVTGYNVPIYSKDNLAYDTYTVTLTHKAAGGVDVGTLNIDGFRVYNTLYGDNAKGSDGKNIYLNDDEDNPVYVELRDLALGSINLDDINTNGITDKVTTVKQLGSQVYSEIKFAEDKTLVTDPETKAYAAVSYAGADEDTGTKDQVQEDLVLNGPKNEIYLSKGSSLTLNVTTARTLQIGLKGVDGQATFNLNGEETDRTVSTVEMFYVIAEKGTAASGKTITIRNDGDALLAVTKLKASDEVAISPVTEETIVSILENAGFEDAVVTDDASLVLSIKTTSGKVLATTTLTATGEAGTEVTFAKADIKAALASLADENGIKLNSRNSYKDVTVAVGSSTAVGYYGSAKK